MNVIKPLRALGAYATGLAAALVLPLTAGAASVSIDDVTEGPVAYSIGGFDPTSVDVQVLPEIFDLHGEYLSTSPLAAGQSVSVNFHFLEPGSTELSDTLNIVFTGHTPSSAEPNNISVDLHFRSDIDGQVLAPLVNPIELEEQQDFMDLSAWVVQNHGPSDFQIRVRSDVPDSSSTFGLLWAGCAMLFGALRLRPASES